jgi:hypothetical protein
MWVCMCGPSGRGPKCEALSSSPSTAKRKKLKRNIFHKAKAAIGSDFFDRARQSK